METEAIQRGKSIHDRLFGPEILGSEDLRKDWQTTDHPIVREFRKYFDAPPEIEPVFEEFDGFPYPRLAIPDLVSRKDTVVVADIKTVGRLENITNIYYGDYLQIAFYRQILGQGKYYILKVYWPEEEESRPYFQWHAIPVIPDHEEAIAQAEKEILAYWEGSLKPKPKMSHCRYCTHQHVCTFYREVVGADVEKAPRS